MLGLYTTAPYEDVLGLPAKYSDLASSAFLHFVGYLIAGAGFEPAAFGL